jgi:hypothetical protein
MKYFNERFQALLDIKKIAPVRFAREFGCHISQVGRWQTAKKTPLEGTILRLVRYFGCSKAWLESGIGEPYPDEGQESQGGVSVSGGSTYLSAGRDAKNINGNHEIMELTELEREVVLLNREVGNNAMLKLFLEKLRKMEEISRNVF